MPGSDDAQDFSSDKKAANGPKADTYDNPVSWFENSVAGIPKQAAQWGKDVGGAVEGLVTDPVGAVEGIPGEIDKNINEVGNLFGGSSTPPNKKKNPPPTPPTPPPNPDQILSGEIKSLEAPLTSELAALPGEYSSAVAGMTTGSNAIPKSGNASLDSALAGTTNALVAGEAGIKDALGNLAPASEEAGQYLPYSDILSTLLTQRKNELLYGTAPSTFTQTVNTKDWSQGLQGIYKYIEGNSVDSSLETGSPATSTTTTTGDTLPSIQAAATGTSFGSVPGPSTTGLGNAS